MINALKNKGYREPPLIPGLIYKNPEPRWLRILIFSFVFALIAYTYFTGWEKAVWAALLISIFVIVNIFFSSKTIFASVTEMTVSAKLENGQEVKNDALNNYVLLIKEGVRSPGTAYSKNYKYGVSLVHKEKMHICDSGKCSIKVYPDRKHQLTITLIDNILCPINLKEWVGSFQNQVKEPLPIIFGSKKIKNDYETGIFRSIDKPSVVS